MKKILGLITVFAVSAIATFTILDSSQSQAANMKDFKPGDIISDAIFTNHDAMTSGDIQDFLNSKNSCLKDRSWPGLYDLNNNGLVEDGGAEYYGVKGTMTSAQIIKAAADIYHINPQVILVILQKESSIITANCNYISTAMGASCPDTAPCDDTKKGFVTQVDYGVSYLRSYMNGRTNYPVGTNYILYNDVASCGGSNVYVENKATGALYTYTPYQPNAAALAAYPGTAPPCGAYGNRNFFAYFTDWFGSTKSHETRGAIGEYWHKIRGSIGTPLGNEVCGLVDGGCYQSFSKGIIIWSEKTGAWESRGGIRERWSKTNFESGYLGYPTGPEYWDGKGWWQAYENGVIIGTEKTGFWDLRGAIRERWQKLGSQTGHLGYPTSSEICGLKNQGCYQKYENSKIIIWSPKSGAWEVFGGIREYWRKLGSESGKMGYPTSPEYNTTAGGRYQIYQNGVIIGTSRTGFWESTGPIRTRWGATNYEHGVIGYPTGPVICGLVRNGCYQPYEHAVMLWSPKSGAWETRGGIRGYWAKLGFESGRTGYPTGPETFNAKAGVGGVWAQTYENGIMRYSEARGGWFTGK